ncbi:hypothetical protein [Planobispora rosea]|nr:hypothetical protein [Planobispora rosea]
MSGSRFFVGCTLLEIGGVGSLRGATVSSRDAQGLLYSLVAALGIEIEN